MRKIYILLIFTVISNLLFSQERTITGKVTDSRGEGIPGATVLLVGTSIGTTTDLDGNYQISVKGGVLRYSFIGFASQEVTITDQKQINIVLLEAAQNLDEVVVIGYGTQRKADLTTAVAVVDDKAIKDRPIISAAQALQGKAAGVQVVQPSGKPGVGSSVRVRGSTSVLAGNEPLYVVDGVPTTDIRGINPTDIASMSVLKDASSAAIYGARAANGVVLITTKKGNDKEASVNYNTFLGRTTLRKTIDVLSTKGYRDLMEEIYPGNLDPRETDYTDWSKEVFGTGTTMSHQLSVAGGSEKSKYFLSAGYLTDQGFIKPARFDRYSVRLNLDNQVKSWFKFGTNISVLRINTKDTPDNASSGRGGVIMSTLNTPPFLNIYDDQDKPGFVLTDTTHFDPNPFQPSWENPIAYMNGPDQQSIDNQIFGNVNAEIRILKDLNFKSRLGVDLKNNAWDYYLDPFRTVYGRGANYSTHGRGASSKYSGFSWLWENTIDYAYKTGKHNFTALAGSSAQKFEGNNSYLEGTDFPSDMSIRTINAANIVTGNTTRWEWALASFFGRATYDYASKYYLTVSVRRDGSSKLAQHWGTMPSFSAGWRISSENFMKDITFIDDLKIRGGWGKNGNQEGIPNYARYGIVSYYRRTSTNPPSGPSAVQTTYGNPDLRWETTAQSNIGFDLTLFNSRVTFNFDAYYKKTSDVLLNVQLSNSLPITTIQTNAGEIVNKGIEFNLSSVNTTGKLKWTSDFNMSFNRNEVTALEYTNVYYYGRIYSNNQDVSIVKVGLPLGSFYGYVAEGVDPETGMVKFADLNNNGSIDPNDRTVIGNAQPDFTWGFTNNLSYRRFDLTLFLQGSQGNDIYNATRIDLEGMFDSKNQSTKVLDRWQQVGDITDIPRAVGGGNVDNVRNSTRFVEDGSYIRLKTATLSYRLLENNPKFRFFKRVSVYVTGENLFTLTNYTGFDPEVNAYGNSATEVGIDYGTYPQYRSFVFGLNVEF